MDMMMIPNYVYLKHVLNDMKYQILQQYILVIFMTGEILKISKMKGEI